MVYRCYFLSIVFCLRFLDVDMWNNGRTTISSWNRTGNVEKFPSVDLWAIFGAWWFPFFIQKEEEKIAKVFGPSHLAKWAINLLIFSSRHTCVYLAIHLNGIYFGYVWGKDANLSRWKRWVSGDLSKCSWAFQAHGFWVQFSPSIF